MKENGKVLVLSCGTGGGHNSAAKAIIEAFQEQNLVCDFKEYLEIINPKLKNYVNRLYVRSTVGKGNAFKTAYHLAELYQKTKIKSPVYGLNSLNHHKLYQYLIENDYQYVITTHLFAAQALTKIKKQHDIHFIAVATDYVCIPFWEETDPDYFIIPSEELKQEFIDKGIKREKLIPLGIPVSSRVRNREDEKALRKKLKLADKRYILISTGSMGFGSHENIIEKLLDEKEDDTAIIFCCGNNERLRKTLEEKFQGQKDLILLPFTNELVSYMKVSEIILTKPGGLTTTEVAAMRKPLILTMPIPGCEDYNARYFQEKQMAQKGNTEEEIVEWVKKLLKDKELQRKMKVNQEKWIDPNANEKIMEFVTEQMKGLKRK